MQMYQQREGDAKANGRGSAYVTKHIQMMVSAWEGRGKSVHEQEF